MTTKLRAAHRPPPEKTGRTAEVSAPRPTPLERPRRPGLESSPGVHPLKAFARAAAAATQMFAYARAAAVEALSATPPRRRRRSPR